MLHFNALGPKFFIAICFTFLLMCCICLAFLICVFSSVPSKCLLETMQDHTSICILFLRCVTQNHNDCICSTFPHCGFPYESSNDLPERMHNYTGNICLTFLHCVFLDASSNCLREDILTLVAFVFLFSTVRFQMSPQIA